MILGGGDIRGELKSFCLIAVVLLFVLLKARGGSGVRKWGFPKIIMSYIVINVVCRESGSVVAAQRRRGGLRTFFPPINELPFTTREHPSELAGAG